jgi:hypothetical protein
MMLSAEAGAGRYDHIDIFNKGTNASEKLRKLCLERLNTVKDGLSNEIVTRHTPRNFKRAPKFFH